MLGKSQSAAMYEKMEVLHCEIEVRGWPGDAVAKAKKKKNQEERIKRRRRRKEAKEEEKKKEKSGVRTQKK